MLFLYLLLSLSLTTRDITEFNQLALRTGMIFTQPAGWDEVPVVKNSQMNYDYAIKPTNGKDFEIRYRIQPLDEMVKKYQEWQKNKPPGSAMVDPNNLYAAMVMATAANIGGKMPTDGKSFSPDAVKRDFGADKGGVTMVIPVKEFGQNFKYCFMLTLQKADKSVAYIFFMANNQADLNTYLPPAFTALRYKD